MKDASEKYCGSIFIAESPSVIFYPVFNGLFFILTDHKIEKPLSPFVRIVMFFKRALSDDDYHDTELLMMEYRHVLIWKLNWLLPWLWGPPMNIVNAF